MKILVLSNLYPPDVIGGYELGCKQAVDALRARGHEVRVLTSAPRSVIAEDGPGVARSLRLVDSWSDYLYRRSREVTVHLREAESLRVSAFNVHALLHQIDDFRPDVAYVWMLVGLGGLGLMACLNHLRVPWVWHLMDDVPLMLCRSHGAIVPAYAREFSRQLRGRYLACSRQLVEEIEAGGIALNDSVEVVPNWVAGPSRPRRSAYQVGGILRIVSAAGVLDRQADKGMDVLIEAAALLRNGGIDRFSVDIFGRDADGHCGHLIHEHGLEAHVTLRGMRTQAELSDEFAEADVFAFPTRAREPFAFAPLEAAARGCVPLISSRCGNAEWFVHGVHLLKANRTAHDFADALRPIADGSIDLATIGRRAAALVAREFRIEAIVPRIESALAAASRSPRDGAGSAGDAYRMAVLAERLAGVMIQESRCA